MIKRAKHSDAPDIINTIASIFPNSNLVKLGIDRLQSNIKEGKQVSFVKKINKSIVGHGGVYIYDKLAILNSLAVHPSFRGKGIGEELHQYCLDYCCTNYSIEHIAAYAMLQHDISQRFLDDSFRPIGISICNYNPYHIKDPFYHHNKLNAEIALCKSKLKTPKSICSPNVGLYENQIRELYGRIGIKVDIRTQDYSQIPSSTIDDYIEVDIKSPSSQNLIKLAQRYNYRSLGILPSAKAGLNILGFASPQFFSKILTKYETNTNERDEFIQKVLSE